MTTEVNKLDVSKLVNAGKLKTVPADLKKLSDVAHNGVVNNTKFNTLNKKVNILDKRISDATTFIIINQCNTDKQNFEKKIRDVDKKY